MNKKTLGLGKPLAMTSALALISAMLAAVPAAAQENGAEATDGGLEEIIVTAQRRSENVQDVPVAISVATGADLERLQVTNVESLQYATPSLVVAGGDPSRKRFGIRGISDQSRNAGFENRVGVYVDGVWVGRSAASNQGALDIATMEILRGPQGTLFGRNTVAGAINITTERPEAGYSGYVEGEIGNYDHRQIRGVFNAGVLPGGGIRVSGIYTNRDGFTRNLFNGLDYDNRDDYSIRAQFQVESGNTTIYVVGDSSRFLSRATAGGERAPDPLAANPREISVNMLQNYSIGYGGASAEIDHEFDNGGKLTSITAYRTSESSGSADEDYSPNNFASTDISDEQTRHVSQELRYASDRRGPFDYVVGLYYLDQRVEGQGRATAFAPALNPRAPAVFLSVAYDAVVQTEALAGFVHANYRFTDRLELTAGARWTHESKSVSYRITDQTGLFTNGFLVDDRSANDFSPTVSLNYRWSDDILSYVRYARGFKSGGWNTDFVRSLPDMAFADESVDAFEIGLKTTLFDRRLRLNLAAYQSSHSDYQVFSFVQLANGGTALNVSNAGELTSRGFEIEAEAAPADWLRLFGNYGYNDSTFDSFRNGGGAGVNFDGNTAAEAPRHNLNLGISTDFELGSAKLVLQADYNYRSAFYSNPDNLAVNRNASLQTVNLRAGVEMGKLSLFAWMRNAFDTTETIYSGRSFLALPRVEYNDPRTYGLTLRIRFGQ